MGCSISRPIRQYVDSHHDRTALPEVVMASYVSLQRAVGSVAEKVLQLVQQYHHADEREPINRLTLPVVFYGSAVEVNLLRSILAEKFYIASSFRATENDGEIKVINLFKQFDVEANDKGTYWRFVANWITLPEIGDNGETLIPLHLRELEDSVVEFISTLGNTDTVIKTHNDLFCRQMQNHVSTAAQIFLEMEIDDLATVCFKATAKEIEIFTEEMLHQHGVIVEAKAKSDGHEHDPDRQWRMDQALGAYQINSSAKCHTVFLKNRPTEAYAGGGAAGAQHLRLTGGAGDND